MLCNRSACNSTITLPLMCKTIPRTTAGASEAPAMLLQSHLKAALSSAIISVHG